MRLQVNISNLTRNHGTDSSGSSSLSPPRGSSTSESPTSVSEPTPTSDITDTRCPSAPPISTHTPALTPPAQQEQPPHQGTASNTMRQESQIPPMTEPIAHSNNDADSARSNDNVQGTTHEDTIDDLRLDLANANETNKRKASSDPSASSSKKKKTGVVAKPPAGNSVKYARPPVHFPC